MTRLLKTIAAAAVAATIGSVSLGAPASAGGSISITVIPQTQNGVRTLQTWFALYQIFNGFRNGANVRQLGQNNLAGIGQYGNGNFGIIHQDGQGRSATLNQYGTGNSYGIFQFGKNTYANVNQSGYAQTGATFQFGW